MSSSSKSRALRIQDLKDSGYQILRKCKWCENTYDNKKKLKSHKLKRHPELMQRETEKQLQLIVGYKKKEIGNNYRGVYPSSDGEDDHGNDTESTTTGSSSTNISTDNNSSQSSSSQCFSLSPLDSEDNMKRRYPASEESYSFEDLGNDKNCSKKFKISEPNLQRSSNIGIGSHSFHLTSKPGSGSVLNVPISSTSKVASVASASVRTTSNFSSSEEDISDQEHKHPKAVNLKNVELKRLKIVESYVKKVDEQQQLHTTSTNSNYGEYKCDQCDFVGKNQRSLFTHRRRRKDHNVVEDSEDCESVLSPPVNEPNEFENDSVSASASVEDFESALSPPVNDPNEFENYPVPASSALPPYEIVQGGDIESEENSKSSIDGDGDDNNAAAAAVILLETSTAYRKCLVCNEPLPYEKKTDKIRYQEHIDIHRGLRPYVCAFYKECRRSFKDPVELLSHTSFAHTEDAAFECEFCNQSFRFKSNFTWHKKKCVSSIHNIVKAEPKDNYDDDELNQPSSSNSSAQSAGGGGEGDIRIKREHYLSSLRTACSKVDCYMCKSPPPPVLEKMPKSWN